MSTFRFICAPVGALCLSLTTSLAAPQQTVAGPPGTTKLNDPLPVDQVGSVGNFLVTPDGSRVLFRQNEGNLTPNQLFSSPADGTGEPIVLNGPTISFPGVNAFTLTPDGTHAVYSAEELTPTDDLYLVPVDGSAPPLQLTSGYDANWSFQVTPDGTHVLFSDYIAPTSKLFKVPLDGSGVVTLISDPTISASSPLGFTDDSTRVLYSGTPGSKLYSSELSQSSSSTLLTPGNTGDIQFGGELQLALGGTQVVYRSTLSGDRKRLYHVPIDGSAPPEQLTGPMGSTRDVERVAVSPDGNHVVYVSDEVQNNKFEMYSVPPDGSAAPIRISGDLPADSDVWVFSSPIILITPDSSQVLYIADGDTENVLELYVVPIDVPTPPARKLNAPINANQDVANIRIDPGSEWVAYSVTDNLLGGGPLDLFATSVDGSSTAVQLDTQSFGANSFTATFFATSNDRVVFQPFESSSRFYSVPRDGSATPTELSGDLGGFVENVLNDPGGDLVFRANLNGALEIFRVPVDGATPPQRLSGEFATITVGDVEEFKVTPNGQLAVYISDQELDHVRELYSVPVDGSAPPTRLSNVNTAPNQLVKEFQITADGQTAVYLANMESGTRDELWLAPTDGSQPPARLVGPLPEERDVTTFSIENNFVVYLADAIVDERFDIFSVPLSPGVPPTQLNVLALDEGDVESFVVDEGATQVVYRADHEVEAQGDLYAVPIDGSQPPVRLNADLPTDGDVTQFDVSADGTVAVYIADQNENDTHELFIALTDGSVPAVRLNPPLVEDGDVTEFQIHPGSRIAFLASALDPTVVELFSVRPNGLGPVRINAPLAAGGDVQAFALAAGDAVVYRADGELNRLHELYVGSIDATVPATLLSAPLPSFGDVTDFALDPTGTLVAYRADSVVENDFDIFGVPIDASQPAVRLNAPLPPGGDAAMPSDINAAGRAIFKATREAAGVFELFSTSLLGGPLVRVNATLPDEGDVLDGKLAGREVVYLAEQDQDGVRELYATKDPTPIQEQP